MSFGSWVVGIFMRFESNGTVVMERLAAQTENANAQLLRQQGLIDANEAAMLRYQRRLAEVRAEQMRLGTMFAGGVAAGGFAAMAYSVGQAAQLQRTLTTIRLATGANTSQMDAIREAAYNISSATAQSVTQSAQILGVMASAGINNPNQLLQIAMPAAKFADVQFLKSGGRVSFEDAARQAIQIAHLYQAYTPAKITPILDTITKLSFMMPDTLNKYLTQAGYYMPVFRRMGVPDDQSAIIGAFLDRMGMGRGKGGTALQDFVIQSMNALQTTAHLQGGHLQALRNLGIIDEHGRNRFYRTDAHGKTTFDLFGELQQINRALDEQTKNLHGSALTAKRADFINDIISAFKIQGGRTAFLATPEGIGQLLNMVQQLHHLPGMTSDQSSYMNTLGGRFNQAVTNLRSVMTELGWPWIDDLTGFFKTLADKTHEFQVFLHHHKDIDKGIGAAVAAVSFWGSARFLYGIGSAAKGALGLAGSMTRLAGASDLATARILRDAGMLDAAAVSKPGVGRTILRDGEQVASGRGALSWLDDFLLAGFGKQLLRVGGGLRGLFVKAIVAPIEGIGPWITRLGHSIGFVGTLEDKSILGNLGRLIAGIGAAGTLAGTAIGGFLRMITGPFSALLFMNSSDLRGNGPRNPDVRDIGPQYAREWLDYVNAGGSQDMVPQAEWQYIFGYRTRDIARHLQVPAPAAPSRGERFDRQVQNARVQHVELVLPRTAPKGSRLRFTLQSVLGTNPTTSGMPKPLVLRHA